LEHLRHPAARGEVFLVGTSHISAASAAEVREVILNVRPQHVMVELCTDRRQRLQAERLDESCSILPGSVFETQGFLEGIKMFYKLLRSAGFDPGQDMLAGLDAGKEVGARLHCGDVEGKVTEQRLKQEFLATDPSALTFKLMRPDVQREVSQLFPDIGGFDLTKMKGDEGLAAAFAKASEKMKDRDKVRRLSELMNTLSPGFAKALLHSRDSHMTKLLRSKTFASERTVCVVGMAHMDGIVRRYTDPNWKEDPPWQAPKPRSRQDQANLSRLLEQELKNFKF